MPEAMEAVAERLARIGKSSVVLKPEQAIQTALIELDKVGEGDSKKLEKILISLLHVNGGELTVACSISIGRSLCRIFTLHEKGQFWSLISDVTENPTTANILALKFVVKKIGQASKNSLSSVAKQLIERKTQKRLVFPRLVCLKALFKVCGESLKSYAASAFSLCESQVREESEAIQIAAVNLGKTVIRLGTISRRKVLGFAERVFNEPASPFVISAVGQLVAFYASLQFKQRETSAQDDDLVLSKKHKKGEKDDEFQDALSILAKFGEHFSIIFSHFLEFLKPEFVFRKINFLFSFVKSHSPNDVTKLTAYFGKNVREGLFKRLFATKDLQILRLLTFDDETARRCSGLAHDAIASKVPEERANAASFLVSLAVTYPKIAMESLQLALTYIAMPPQTSISEYEGMASIAAIILSTFGTGFEFDYEMKQYFGKFVNDCLTTNLHNDVFLVALFMVTATVDDKHIPVDKMKPVLDTVFRRMAIEMTKENSSMPMRLVECVLVFLSAHPSFTIAKEFNEICFRMLAKLTHVGHYALLRSIVNVAMEPQFYAEAAFSYLNLVINLGIPLEFIKRKIPNLMKLPEEVLRVQQRGRVVKDLTSSSAMFFVDAASLAAKICDSLPAMFVHLNVSETGRFLTTAINTENRVVGHLVILSLYQHQEASKKLPQQFDDCLLQFLETGNIVSLQITAECVAYHIEQHTNRLVSVLGYVQENPTVASCFLEAAIARRIQLSDANLMEMIFRISKRLLIPELTNAALQEMASIYERKSIQMVGMLMGDQQCQNLLDLLNSPSLASLYTYHLISVCLEKLVPILLPNLQSQETVGMVIIALASFKWSPLPIMKRYFYESFRAVSAFSKDIATFFKVKLPTSPMLPIETKLAMCGALADLSKVRPFSINIQTKMPGLLVLLQRTGDKRAHDLIVAAASCFAKKEKKAQDLVEWFQMTKALLSGNTMLGFGTCQVEPNAVVKYCSLNVMSVLLPDLARRKPFQASCLDDLMTSTLRALESGKDECHQVAYAILKDVIVKFRDVRTETNSGLLDLYESQFSAAIRHSFPTAVDDSAEFHCAYLDFYFQTYQSDLKSCLILLETYVRGLSTVKLRTAGYYAITSKICAIARRYPSICDEINAFLEGLVVPYSELVVDSIKLRTIGADWAQVSSYRERIAPFYVDLLPSTVWLRKRFSPKDSLTLDALVAFLLYELTSGSEGWRSQAAFAALDAVMDHYGEDLPANMFSLVVTTMCHVSKWNSKLLGSLVPEFLSRATALAQPGSELWGTLCNTACCHNCNGVSFGRILKFTPVAVITKSAGVLAEAVLRNLKAGFMDELEAVAAFTVLFDYSPDAIPALIPHIIGIDGFCKFKLQTLERAYTRVGTRAAIDKVALFFAENVTVDAMQVLGKLSIRQTAIFSEILRRGVASAYLAHEFKPGNGVLALNFFAAMMTCLSSYKPVCTGVADAAVELLKQDGSSHTIGEQVAVSAVNLLKACDSAHSESSSDAFSALDEATQEDLKRILTKYASKKRVRKVSLVKFSDRVRRSTASDGDELESVELD